MSEFVQFTSALTYRIGDLIWAPGPLGQCHGKIFEIEEDDDWYELLIGEFPEATEGTVLVIIPKPNMNAATLPEDPDA